VIFTTGRAGSELLARMLTSTRGVVCDSEILTNRVRFPFLYVQAHAVRAGQAGAAAYGFKLLTAQLSEAQGMLDPSAFLRRLSDHGYIIVTLTRRHLLRQTVSWAQSHDQQFHYSSAAEREASFRPVRIEPELAVAMMVINERITERLRSEVGDLPHIPLVYEDDLEDPGRHQATADRVLGALGLPSEPVQAPIVRSAPPRIADAVENYEEVAAVLSRTRFAHFLDDAPGSGSRD
jgi:hypothetical protein